MPHYTRKVEGGKAGRPAGAAFSVTSTKWFDLAVQAGLQGYVTIALFCPRRGLSGVVGGPHLEMF